MPDEKTLIKGIGFCSIDSDGHTSEIDIKDGKNSQNQAVAL